MANFFVKIYKGICFPIPTLFYLGLWIVPSILLIVSGLDENSVSRFSFGILFLTFVPFTLVLLPIVTCVIYSDNKRYERILIKASKYILIIFGAIYTIIGIILLCIWTSNKNKFYSSAGWVLVLMGLISVDLFYCKFNK